MRGLLVAASMCGAALADVYMHNPRGSNDRNCERNVNRNNGNRLFDSQNNAKGYVWPAVSWKLESAAPISHSETRRWRTLAIRQERKREPNDLSALRAR